jgi:hypothetical protein
MAVASQRHWGGVSRNAVLPAATTLNSRLAAHAIFVPAHHFECFLHLLTIAAAQKSLDHAHTAPPHHPGGPAPVSSAPSENEAAAGKGNDTQHKLGRLLRSVMGKEVSAQDIPSLVCDAGFSLVLQSVLKGRCRLWQAVK